MKIRPLTLLLSLCVLTPSLSEDLTQVPLRNADFENPPQTSKPGILWFWHEKEMTDEVIEEQIQEMEDAGFGSMMMFPLGYKPKFYSEHFYERYAKVLAEAKKREMGIWMTVDSAIPTGHGATKVVGGGKVNEELTLEPRDDLRAQILLHGPREVSGGHPIDLKAEFPGISNLSSTVKFEGGRLTVRKCPYIVLNEGQEWTDYTLKTQLTANNWAGNPLIVAGYIENGMCVRWNKDTQSGYAWSLHDNTTLGKGVPALSRRVIKEGRTIQSLPPVKIDELEHGKDYTFEIRVQGNTIETLIDGKSVDVVENDTFTSGTVGMYTPGLGRSVYRKVEVIDASGVILTEDFTDPSGWIKWAPPAPIEEVFCVAAIPVRDGVLQAEGIIDLTEQFQAGTAWEAPAGDWKLEYFMKRRDLSLPFNYPDLFNEEVILRHQQIIYEEMFRRFPDYMGSTIKGFWSDEPHRTDDDVWSESFPPKFAAKGVKVAEVLSAFYNDLGRQGRMLRAPYYQLVHEGWTEPFAKIQGNWCRARGLDWMTNPTCDSAPPYGGYSAGNALQMNQWSNAPGVDAIFGQIRPDKRSYISRWATSSAHQQGNQYILYEVYGGYGWDVTPDLIRYVNGNLMVRGCNRVSYHAYWTNPDKVGYAPPFDPSNTYWHAQDELNLWNGRVQEANLGKAISEVALLVPNSTQYADHLEANGRMMNSYWGQAYYLLEDHPLGFDLIDESSLNDNPIMKLKAEPVEGALKCGEQQYQVVVLPHVSTLSLKALQTLRAAVEQGTTVIAHIIVPLEELEGKDAELAAEVQALFGPAPSNTAFSVGKGQTYLAKTNDELNALIGQLDLNLATITPVNPKIQVLKRERQGATVYLLMNESEVTTYSTVSFNETSTPEVWNPETGEHGVAPAFKVTGETVNLPLILTPYQTKIVVFKDGAAEVPHLIDSTLEAVSTTEKDGSLRAKVLTRRTGEHTLQGMLKGSKYSGSISLPALPTDLGINSDWSMSYADQPGQAKPVTLGDWASDRPDYSGSATYTTSFNFPTEALGFSWQLDLGVVKDVVDLKVNGKPLPTILWRPYVADLTPYLRPGANALEVTVTNTLGNKHGEKTPSGLIGPVQLKSHHAAEVVLSKVGE